MLTGLSGFKKVYVAVYILNICAALLQIQTANADVITLENGRTFEGVIKQETAKSITIDIGLGSISLRRSQIGSIEYSEQAEKIPKQQHKFNSSRVPPSYKPLAKQFESLNKAHFSAKKAQYQNKNLQQSAKKKFSSITRLKDNYVRIARQLNQTPAIRQNVRQYNQLITQQNQINNDIVLLHTALKKENAESTKNHQIVENYLSALSAFETDFSQARETYERQSQNERSTVFFQQLADKLDALDAEFKEISIAHERKAEHFIVQARINNRVTGRFMLDTGASVITLSPDIARRLGLKYSKNLTISVSLANGARQNAFPVLLNSVQVGEAKAKNVRAIILPEANKQGFDGLLGMSFLKEFTIQMNSNTDTLVLKKFKPN